MTDHKLTDDDVIKALELCSKLDLSFEECNKCPYKGECGTKDGNMPADALALINRQMRELDDLKRDTIPKLQNGLERANYYGLKADEEIEHLKAEIERLNAVHADMTESLRLAAEANKDMSVELDAMRGAANSYKMHYEEAELKYQIAVAEREANVEGFIETLKTIKAEAIKEFAEKLKEKAFYCERTDGKSDFMVAEMEIDNLVKEMTEETK